MTCRPSRTFVARVAAMAIAAIACAHRVRDDRHRPFGVHHDLLLASPLHRLACMNTSVSREPSTLRECDARLQPPRLAKPTQRCHVHPLQCTSGSSCIDSLSQLARTLARSVDRKDVVEYCHVVVVTATTCLHHRACIMIGPDSDMWQPRSIDLLQAWT